MNFMYSGYNLISYFDTKLFDPIIDGEINP